MPCAGYYTNNFLHHGRVTSAASLGGDIASAGAGNMRRKSARLRSAASSARARSSACASATAARCSAFASSSRRALISSSPAPVPAVPSWGVRIVSLPPSRSVPGPPLGNTLNNSEGSMLNVSSSFLAADNRPDFMARPMVDLLRPVALAACESDSPAMRPSCGCVSAHYAFHGPSRAT